MSKLRIGFLLALGWILAVAPPARADSAAAPQVQRSVLERHDLDGVDGKEVILGTATLPPGAVVGWHIHHGDETGYVLKGRLVLKVQGQPDRVLQAGDHFFNPAGVPHSVAAEPGGEGGTALSAWIVDKGKPLAEPVSGP